MSDIEKAGPYLRVGDRDRQRVEHRLAVARKGGYIDDDQLLTRLRNVDEAATENVLAAQVQDLPTESVMAGFSFSARLTRVSDWATRFDVDDHSLLHYAGLAVGGALLAGLPTAFITTLSHHGYNPFALAAMVACLIIGIVTVLTGIILFAIRCDS